MNVHVLDALHVCVCLSVRVRLLPFTLSRYELVTTHHVEFEFVGHPRVGLLFMCKSLFFGALFLSRSWSWDEFRLKRRFNFWSWGRSRWGLQTLSLGWGWNWGTEPLQSRPCSSKRREKRGRWIVFSYTDVSTLSKLLCDYIPSFYEGFEILSA